MVIGERATGSYLELGGSVVTEQNQRQSQLRNIFRAAIDLLKSEESHHGRVLFARVNIFRKVVETERGTVGVEIIGNGKLDRTRRVRIEISGLVPVTVTRKNVRDREIFSAKKSLTANEYLAWQHYRGRLTPEDYDGFERAMQDLAEAVSQ